MKYINENLNDKLPNLATAFHNQGFVKVDSFLSKSFIEYLQENIDKVIDSPIDNYQKGFNRISFDLFTEDKTVMGLLTDQYFRSALTQIVNRDLFFTQGLGFELKKNKSSGFPWHIGT